MERLQVVLDPLLEDDLEILKPPGSINTGLELTEELKTAWVEKVEESQLIIFIISADGLANELIKKDLLKLAIARASEGCALLIPVYFRKCLVNSTELSHFMRYSQRPPVSEYPNPDDGYFEVSEGLLEVINSFGKQITQQKQSFEQQQNLVNTFNFYHQITDQARQQIQAMQGWCRLCLLQGGEKSGFNLLAWRIRVELAGLPKDAPTLFRAISLETTRDQAPGEVTTLICKELLPDQRVQSIQELVPLLRQHLNNQHLVLYLPQFTLLDAEPVAGFFAQLQAAWKANRKSPSEPDPPNKFWCFPIYTGEAAVQLPLGDDIASLQVPAVKPVEQADFEKWLEAQIMDSEKKTLLSNKLADIVGNAPDNELLPVLERLCKRLSLRTILYEEYVLKLDNGLIP